MLVISRKLEDGLVGAIQKTEAGEPNNRTLKDMFYEASGNDLQMPSGWDSRTFLPSEVSLIMRQNPQHPLSPGRLQQLDSKWQQREEK